MNISKRLYTYPVLSDETGDYEKAEFFVEMSQKTDRLNTIDFDFKITMTSEDLRKLIAEKKADYMIHVECSETAFRAVYRSFIDRVSFEIPLEKVNGNIALVSFIVAREDIKDFHSSEWVEDFDDLSFSFEKGTILAYQNLDNITVTKDFEDFTDASSIISITKHFDRQQPAKVNLEGSRIRISLYEKDYDKYFSKASGSTEARDVLNSIVVFPALVQVFSTLINERDDLTKYSGRNWFVSLEKSFLARGVDFRNRLEDEEIDGFTLAQEVMELPIGKSIQGIDIMSAVSGSEEEE